MVMSSKLTLFYLEPRKAHRPEDLRKSDVPRIIKQRRLWGTGQNPSTEKDRFVGNDNSYMNGYPSYRSRLEGTLIPIQWAGGSASLRGGSLGTPTEGGGSCVKGTFGWGGRQRLMRKKTRKGSPSWKRKGEPLELKCSSSKLFIGTTDGGIRVQRLERKKSQRSSRKGTEKKRIWSLSIGGRL